MNSPRQRSSPGGVTSHQGRSNAHHNAATASTDSVQAAADEAAMRFWSRVGHDIGWQSGYQYAYHEQAEVDRLRVARMHGVFTSPAYAELERVRWAGRREDFGKPRPGDHPGGPVDWETSRPLRDDAGEQGAA